MTGGIGDGAYQHCGEQYLHGLAAKFEFRYNHGAKLGVFGVGLVNAIKWGIEGKRLTYRRTAGAEQVWETGKGVA